jgi:phosphatidylglycerol:prolipoprotein diacylglycerol transferase
MRAVLFRVGGTPIHSYPAMLAVGAALGTEVELHAAASIGLDRGRALAATLLLLPPALLGARWLYLIGTAGLRRALRGHASRRLEGGATMYGGLLVAVAASAALLPALDLPFGPFWDAATFALLVGMAVARVGCLLDGCCAGRLTRGPLGVCLHDHHGHRARRFPTQLLEAAWGAAVLAGACLLWRRLPFAGGVFLYTVGAYGAGRMVLQPMRQDPDRLFGLPLQRLVSAALVVISAGAFATWTLTHG